MPDLPADSPNDTVVAIVVMRPASGEPVPGDAAITAETLDRFAPDRGVAAEVARAFDEAGFATGPLVGISMSLSGPRERFESLFDVTLEPDGSGGWKVAGDAARDGDAARGAPDAAATGDADRALPTERLPARIAGGVQSIVFEPPVSLDGEEMTPGAPPTR